MSSIITYYNDELERDDEFVERLTVYEVLTIVTEGDLGTMMDFNCNNRGFSEKMYLVTILT